MHLFERDCSMQRRHQKVLEEAPAPRFSSDLRATMGKAATDAARAVAYVGAGTVEFLLESNREDKSGDFYFLEMNTRLQVEHPVTEMITGLDLVEWQLRVAAGEPLAVTQDDLQARGHAIEARIYAEDPRRGFLPSSGRLTHLRLPRDSEHVRVDTGVCENDIISVHYDPMIAKLIVWGETRAAARRRLHNALSRCEVVGVDTNTSFLAAVTGHPSYEKSQFDTGFLEREQDGLVARSSRLDDAMLSLAVLHCLYRQAMRPGPESRDSPHPQSPWHRVQGWRLNRDARQVLSFVDDAGPIDVEVHHHGASHTLHLPSGAIEATGRPSSDAGSDTAFEAVLGDRIVRGTVVRFANEITVFLNGASRTLGISDPDERAATNDSADGHLTAPMPGKIIAVMVAPGDKVSRGTPLLVLEAMKMEHTIAAPADGTVEHIVYEVGDQVEEAAELIVLGTESGSKD